jgi:hypothetical protein
MDAIYEYYSSRGTSFENTLALLQELLSERLSPDYRRIWVQASNSGRTRFCFTIFPERGQYIMRFLESGSFRQFRSDGNLEVESDIIENFIDSLSNSVLNNIIV